MQIARLACLLTLVGAMAFAAVDARPAPRLSEAQVRARQAMVTGLEHVRLGRHREAIATFSKAINSKALNRADRVRALFDRGVAHDALGEERAAITDYTAALNLDRKFSPAFNNRANLYRRMGRLAEAKRDYLAALKCPGVAREYPYYGLGLIAAKLGNNDSAKDFFLKALAANPAYALAAEGLGAVKVDRPTPIALNPPKQEPPAAAPSERITQVLKPPKPQSTTQETPKAAEATIPRQPTQGPVAGAAEAPPSHEPPQAAQTALARPVAEPSLRRAIVDPAKRGGGIQVQLGAYKDEQMAVEGWAKISAGSGGLLDQLAPLTVAVDLPGKGRLWRLRTVVADKAAARTLCASLEAKGFACAVAWK